MSTDTRFWHPFADMAAVRGAEIVMQRGEGTSVWDADGNRYFDGTASLWCVNVGHGRQEIADAVARQMEQPRQLLGLRRVRQRAVDHARRAPGRRTPRTSSTIRASSSGSAAATRSTPPPSSRGATSPPSASPTAST